MSEANKKLAAVLKRLHALAPDARHVVMEIPLLQDLLTERTWLPIETAPQKPAARGVRGDQEALLVWRPGLPEGITAFQHLPDAEWYSCETGMPLGWKPTRWQPLPEPPEEPTP